MIFLLDFQNPTNFYITLLFSARYMAINCVYNFDSRKFYILCHQCINFTLITSTFEIQPFFPSCKFPPSFIFLAILMHLFFLHMKIKSFSLKRYAEFFLQFC